MPAIPRPHSGSPRHWHLTLLTIAATSAIAVSVIYLPQSLLTVMSRDLGISPAAASVVATAVQIGYAVGIFLLVPLGDRITARRQVSVQSLALAIALVLAALSPTIVALVIAFVCVGLVANTAQILIPTANRMAPPDRRAVTNGTIAGALMVGIFGGRILASFLVEFIGWRWVVVIFAGCVLIGIPFVRRVLPTEPAESQSPRPRYLTLLRSTAALMSRSAVLVESAAIQFLSFGTFTAMWTVMVLHLTGPDYGWSITQAGLFGFLGLAAGFITPLSGRFIDRFGRRLATGVGLGGLLTATLISIPMSGVIAVFAPAMFVLTLANQSLQTATQSRILEAHPDAQAQANTMYMMCVFGGGSVGAALGSACYGIAGMPLVAGIGAAFSVIGVAIWLLTYRRTGRQNAEG